MKTRTSWLATMLFLAFMCVFAKGDSVILRDGRHVRGKFSGGTQGVIAFTVGTTVQYFDVRNVLAMTFGEEAEAPANPEQDQVVPILPNSNYLRPNRTAPQKNARAKVTQSKYIARKRRSHENQTLAQ